MKRINLPQYVPVPFASNADPQYVDTIPESPPGIPGRASMQGGFPPETFEPIASGGTPPFGQDMNGILLLATAWNRWQGAGAPVSYDATFSADIGGYPLGAALAADNGLGWWVSKLDDNTSDPDAAGAGWTLVSIDQVYAGDPNGHVAGQAATTLSAPTLCWDTDSLSFWWCSTTGNAASAVWTNLSVLSPISYVNSNTRNYTAADLGRVIARSSTGSASMTDTLPSAGTVENGWSVTIQNVDASDQLTINAPGGTTLNGVAAGSQVLRPNQSVKITSDGSTGFLITQVPVPVVFSAQAIYVNSSGGPYAPGVYHLDSSAGAFTFQLQSGGTLGDNYTFKDVGGALSANPVTIDPNGATINGIAGNFLMDVNWEEGVVLSLKSGNYGVE